MVEPSRSKSFYCGDVLGRTIDWSNTDRLFVEACGLRVLMPEDEFPIHPLAIQSDAEHWPAVLIIIMVGAQGSGKTTFAKKT